MPIALAITVIGIILLVIGVGGVDSIHSSFARLFTGHLTDRTMWLVLGGCLCIVVGLSGCYRSRRI
jgi:hypothetical protein